MTQEKFPAHVSEIKQTQVDGCAEREQGDWSCDDWVWPSGAVDALTTCMQTWGNHAPHVKKIAYDDGSLPSALNVAVSVGERPNISTAVPLSDSVLRRIVEILEGERQQSAEAVGDWLQANMCGAGAAEAGSEAGCNLEEEEEFTDQSRLEHNQQKKKKKKKKKKKRKEGEDVVDLGGEQQEGGGENQGSATQESMPEQKEEEVLGAQKQSTPDGAAPTDAAAEPTKRKKKKAKKTEEATERKNKKAKKAGEAGPAMEGAAEQAEEEAQQEAVQYTVEEAGAEEEVVEEEDEERVSAHRQQQERSSLRRQCIDAGWGLVKVEEDGRCLWVSLADQVSGSMRAGGRGMTVQPCNV